MKAKERLTILFVAFTILLSLVPLAQAVTNSPSLGSIQIFPEHHILIYPELIRYR